MPALLGRTVASLACSSSEWPVQDAHTVLSEQGWLGACSQHCCAFCIVPGGQRPVLPLSSRSHRPLLVSAQQWAGSAAGWGGRIRFLGWGGSLPWQPRERLSGSLTKSKSPFYKYKIPTTPASRSNNWIAESQKIISFERLCHICKKRKEKQKASKFFKKYFKMY